MIKKTIQVVLDVEITFETEEGYKRAVRAAQDLRVDASGHGEHVYTAKSKKVAVLSEGQ